MARYLRRINHIGKQNMIKNSKQNWTVGQKVKVGFMKELEVVEAIPTPGDFAPDQYLLRAKNGVEYIFTPHKGLVKTQ